MDEAIAREKTDKIGDRAKKLALIEANNPAGGHFYHRMLEDDAVSLNRQCYREERSDVAVSEAVRRFTFPWIASLRSQ